MCNVSRQSVRQPHVFFPEPAEPDETRPTWDETAIDYLSRSSTPKAVALREFLNRSLLRFPRGHSNSLARRLRHDWQAHFFEIVVGRYLQVLGADVQPEPIGTNGTHIDFRATFPDGVVSVECVTKRYNAEANAELDRQSKLSQLIDDIGPVGWIVGIDELPEANSPDEFAPFLEQARAWFASLPPPVQDGPRLRVSIDIGDQRLEIEAIPAPAMNVPVHIGPGVDYIGDAVQRLTAALTDEHKREQARGARPPVLLAIECPWGGPDKEDFDRVLFGEPVTHIGLDRNVAGFSFNANGLLVNDRGIPFAGVMAFVGMSMVGAGDPVLYLNPHQRWQLPIAIAGHETRAWTLGIEVQAASREPTIESIGFVDYSR